MLLSDVSIRRPVFTVMVTAALMTLGLLGARNLGVDLFPDVSFPIVLVTTVYPGAGPQEVEQQVTAPIEEQISSINGIDIVRSFSRDSVSIIVAQFKLEADVKAAATDVRERVAGLRAKLPRDIRDPLIQRFDPNALPILTYVVSSDLSPAETRRVAEDVIKPRLEAVDGVASVVVTGGHEREVQVLLHRSRLEELGLSVAQVAQQLGMEGFDLPAGRLATATAEVNVKTENRFRSLQELGDVVVASLATGAQVHLRDVATLRDAVKEVRTGSRLDGRESVTVEIQKQSGSNTVAVADGVFAAVGKVEKLLPPGMKLMNAIDTSIFIRRNIHDVSWDIVFGGLMAVLVIFLFMLDWRSTLISSLSLPTSVITTFFVMWLLDFSFNMMTLLALSLSIGLLIDDAVVVRENIFRHMEMGKDPIRAARDGTAQIGLAVMATTFTIVAVFVPVAFMGGMVGMFFKQFGLTVTAAVLVSLFVSFTLDPMMSARVMKPVSANHHEELRAHPVLGRMLAFYDGMNEVYRSILRWSLAHRWAVALSATLLFVGALALVTVMPKEFMAAPDRGEFVVFLESPGGTSYAEMDRVTKEAEAAIRRASKEVRTLFTTVGPGEEVNKARVRVYTTKVEERRPVTQWQIQELIRAELRKIPQLKFSVAEIGMFEGGNDLPVAVFIRGTDYAQLQAFARKALEAVTSTPGAVDPDMSFRGGKPETALRVDRLRAGDLGVSPGLVAQTVRLGLEGEVVAKFRDRERDVDVRLRLAEEDRASIRELSQLTVPATGRRMGSASGPPPANPLAALFAPPRPVRLDQVAQTVSGTGPATIEREARQRQIIISANLANRPLGDVVKEIETKLKALETPKGVTWTFGGQSERMQETFSNMVLALLVGVLFIFMVLASQFESFVHPFTIMLALPLAIVGAFMLLFLTGQSLSMASMIGIILLMGLVTKNAILLVDYANELRDKGMSAVDALLEAGPTRLRPILMTSAAMVLGMLPGALARGEGAEFKAPMAIGVIGGVVASTFLTLVVVPVVYTWMDKLTLRARRARRSEGAADTKPAAATAPGQVAAMTALGGEDA